MKKSKNKKVDPDYENMSDQKPGSALYIQSHQDFNNEHPEHDENGLINGNVITEVEYEGNDNKQTSDMKKAERKSGKEKVTKTYTCPMHPEVISDKTGKCPKCGMELIEKKQ